MRNRKKSAPTVKKTVLARVHERRAEQHADGIQIIGEPRHDVAGAIALIEAGVLPFEFFEEIVAQIELDLARDADQNPALGVEEDALDERDADQKASEDENLAANVSVAQVIDCSLQYLGNSVRLASDAINCPLNHLRKEHPDGVGADATERAPHISPAVAAQITGERGEVAKHGFIVRGGALFGFDDLQALHGGEVAQVEGGNGAASFDCRGCDNQIVIADHLPARLQPSP